MESVRPPLVPNDREIVAKAYAHLERFMLFQKQFEADVRKLQKPLLEATRLLGEIEVVLEHIKRLR